MLNKTRCSTCEQEYSPELMKKANSFDAKGARCYLMICQECESSFDKMDIAFDFVSEKKQ